MAKLSPSASADSDVVELFTDGACQGNPGPGGWGVVMRYKGHEKTLYGGEANTTNNRMELVAAIIGLETLKRRSKVRLTTDSRYLKNGLTQWFVNWQRRGWKTAHNKPLKNLDLWQRLACVASRHEIEWHWVKGHTGHPENERADELAKRGIEEVLSRQRDIGKQDIINRAEGET